MKFQSGILGVIVVVVALMGTIFGGYILNVNSETIVTTDYTSVTDVSSLYSYRETPDYIEYNPAKNFTGYQLSNGSDSGISFTQSSTINQYYMGQSSGSSSIVDVTSLLTRPTAPSQFYTMYTPYNYDANTDTGYAFYDYDNYTNAVSYTNTPLMVNMIDLIDYLKSTAPAGTDRITINIPTDSDMNVMTYARGTGHMLDNRLPIVNSSSTTNVVGWGIVNGLKTSGTATQNTDIDKYTFFDRNSISVSFDNNTTAENTIFNINFNNQYNLTIPSDYSINRHFFGFAPSTTKMVTISNYTSSSRTGTIGNYSGWHGGNYTLEVVYSWDVQYYYMNPSQGVSINNPSNLVTTDWTNNKTNHQVNILFGVNGDTCSNTIRTPLGDEISLRYDGTTNYVKTNLGLWTDIGSWEHFMLTIDGHQGKVTVTPVIDFVNFQTYNLTDYTYDIGTITVSPFTKLIWLSTNDSYKFSVTSTMVEVTNKLFMVDPSLNIRDYFPLDEGFKLEMSSFTKLGDSITINGTTFYGDADMNTIESTGHIYIPSVEESIKLGTMYIIEDELDGHTYIQSSEWGSSRIDLGETTSSVISASGVWFFTNQLYEGKIVDADKYIWEWANNLTSTQSIMIWLGLIIAGTLIARRFFNFTILDLAIVIASSIILYAILGVF